MPGVRQREIWIDNIKVIACVLVVLGHFFQSMTKAEILPANALYQWFNQTIYYFHVPLFFICSGYLYQKLSVVNDRRSWKRNVLKKALNLGIPYFAFSFATWLLKTCFSGSVNSESGGLLDTLFVHPTSPYWYLYALFFLFLITPTFKNKSRAIIGLVVALILKAIGCIEYGGERIQVVTYILSNEIWFVIGMSIKVCQLKTTIEKMKLRVPIAAGFLFLLISVVVYVMNLNNGFISFLVGLVACFSIVVLTASLFEKREQSKVFGFFARYTMPIFLMHTLCAAPLRAVLLKVGIQNAVIHVILGLAISFIGPIIVAVIMKKMKWPEIFLYPGKFIKIKN